MNEVIRYYNLLEKRRGIVSDMNDMRNNLRIIEKAINNRRGNYYLEPADKCSDSRLLYMPLRFFWIRLAPIKREAKA